MSSHVLPKKLLVLGLVLPVAVYLGFRLADPDFGSLGIVGLLTAILCIPLALKWHHPLLILSWNLPMTIFVLPGNPSLWMLMGFISLGISMLGTVMDKEQKLINVPVMTWAMLGLALVVVFTMTMTGGGFGLRSLGGTLQGGRKYFYILFSIVAYFGVSCQRFPAAKSNWYIAIFLLPGLVTSFSNLIYSLGPGLWFLYYLFPVDWALGQAAEDFAGDAYSLHSGRLAGLGVAGNALFSYLLARYGVRGILDIRSPWRAVALVLVAILGLLGGFRSVLVLYVLLFGIQFYLEGLHRTRMMPVLLAGGLLVGLAVVPFTHHLPLSIQRCISFLPVDVNPAVRADAAASTEWRLQMWEVIGKEIPKYFWIGKGYTGSAADQYLTAQAVRLGLVRNFEGSMIAGDYHSGPLSLIVPFGIWGVLVFLLFSWACLHVLMRNYRHGDPAVKHINTFLLAFFLTRLGSFLFVFGAVHLDVPAFAGLVAFSISLNGGVCRARAPVSAKPEPAPAPAARAHPRRWMPVRP